MEKIALVLLRSKVQTLTVTEGYQRTPDGDLETHGTDGNRSFK